MPQEVSADLQEMTTQEVDPLPLSQVEECLSTLAGAPRLPAWTKSRNVREQFQHAFQLIGGIPRLAHWAHSEPGKFYALYSKLIPAQVTGADGGAIKIELSWINGRDTSGRSDRAVIDVDPHA